MATSGLSALRAAAIVLVVGLVIAIMTPDSALTGRSAGSLFDEMLRLTVATTMASGPPAFTSSSRR